MGSQVIAELTLNDDESWMEACRHYKACIDEERANAKPRKKVPSAPAVHRCRFCDKPASLRPVMVSHFICEGCTTKFAKMITRHKASHKRKRKRRTRGVGERAKREGATAVAVVVSTPVMFQAFCSLNLNTSPKPNKTMQPASMIGLTIYEHGYFTRDQIGNDFVSFL